MATYFESNTYYQGFPWVCPWPWWASFSPYVPWSPYVSFTGLLNGNEIILWTCWWQGLGTAGCWWHWSGIRAGCLRVAEVLQERKRGAASAVGPLCWALTLTPTDDSKCASQCHYANHCRWASTHQWEVCISEYFLSIKVLLSNKYNMTTLFQQKFVYYTHFLWHMSTL